MKNYPLYDHPDITNLKQLVARQVNQIPESIAFQYIAQKEKVTITYSQFRQDIDAVGTFFYQQSFQNVKIALIGENSYHWILAYFAITMGSNIAVPIDKSLPNSEICSLLNRCETTALIYSDFYADIAEEMLRLGCVQKIFNINDFSVFMKTGNKLIENGNHSFQENQIDEDAVCSIIFTSGTTGVPKGVMLSQRNLVTDALGSCRNVFVEGPSLLTLPLHHTFALTAGVLAMLIYGVPICISNSLRTFQADIQTFKPHHIFLVPLYVEAMNKMVQKAIEEQGKSELLSNMTLKSSKEQLNSILAQFGGELKLIISGGAPILQNQIDKMEDIGIQVLNGYGITECSPVAAVNRNQYFRKNSVGLPLSCCEVKIQDGEILIKGSNVMLGYYHDEEATRQVLENGWFKTGDLGYLDQDGFLYITGRKKNLIILSNGENISPEELEKEILNAGGVKEVLIYVENQMITAEIFTENEDMVCKNIAALNRELPPYKRIQNIKFRSMEFEKTPTQKIKRSSYNI